MNQVFVCGTYFHIYVSILKSIYREDRNSKSLIVINDHTPNVEKILPGLIENGFFDSLIQVPFRKIDKQLKKNKKVFNRLISRNKLAIESVEKNSGILKFDEFIRNSEINLFYNLGLTPGYFLLKYKNNFIRLVEDGEGNYTSRVGLLKEFRRKYILKTFVGDGLDDHVKEIEVQYPDKLVKRLKHKGKKLELKKMEEELSAENRDKILKLFMCGLQIELTGRKKLLLITQPLSEDKHMTENQKVEMYNQILKHYVDRYSLFIKPHPREETNYQEKINYNFTSIPQGFPLEMFDYLNGIHFELGITVSSSSLYNINCVDKKIILGRKYFKKLLPSNWFEEHEKVLQLSNNS